MSAVENDSYAVTADKTKALFNAIVKRKNQTQETTRNFLQTVAEHDKNRRDHIHDTTTDFLNKGKEFAKRMQERNLSLQELQERFSIFEIVSDTYYRENFHSDVIAYLLNPDEKHGLGMEPSRLFIDWLDNPPAGAGDREGTRQPQGSTIKHDDFATIKTPREQGRIDVLIEGNGGCVIIENKINEAVDQDAQLQRYHDYISQTKQSKVCAVVYLTPDGHSPSKNSLKDRKGDIENVLYNIRAYPCKKDDHDNLICGWLEPVLAHAVKTINDIDVLSFLRQYIILLKKLGGRFMSNQNTIEFLKVIAPEMEKGGEINEDYYNIAWGFLTRKIDLAEVATAHLAETMQLEIKGKNTGFKMHKRNRQIVYADFTLWKDESKQRYGIELWERNWGHDYSIEIFYRRIDNGSLLQPTDDLVKDVDLSKLKGILQSVIDEHGCNCNGDNSRLFIKGIDGIQYIGNEEGYRKTVIEVLRAFAKHAKDHGLKIEHRS